MFSLQGKSRVNKRFPSSKHSPRGFTQLEVLLVLSVILLNCAIILPLVQTLRESARRNQCQHNLKQLGLAVSNYVDACECFPSGFDVIPEGNYLGWGWNLKILPYMNAADLYNTIEPHFAEGILGLPDTAEFHQRLPSLWCPSDSGAEMVPHAVVVTGKVVDGTVSEGAEVWQRRLPHSSYFGNAGYLQLEAGGIQYNAAGIPTSISPLINAGSLGHVGTIHSRDYQYCDQRLFGGFFGQNSHVGYRAISDGTSNTFMIGERYSPIDSSAGAVGHGTWIGVPDCTRPQGLAMALGDASVRINIGRPLREQTTGFGSLHHGGTFFVFGDGQVRFISDLVTIDVFRQLSVIDDYDRSNVNYSLKH